jgi:hypothetical protein
VVLHFVDGQRGDDDLSANGVILEPGAPVIRQFTAPAPGFVITLYELVLERDPTAAELQHWTKRLAAGTSRLTVARDLWQTPEHRRIEVAGLVHALLHRASDPASDAPWVRALGSGAGETSVAQRLLVSSAYQSTHTSLASFVSGLEAEVLGGSLNPDDPALRRLMRRDTRAGRSALARAALTSPAAAARLLTVDDETFLGHPPGPAQIRQASVQLRGRSDAPAVVAERIVASQEFFDLASAMTAQTTTQLTTGGRGRMQARG